MSLLLSIAFFLVLFLGGGSLYFYFRNSDDLKRVPGHGRRTLGESPFALQLLLRATRTAGLVIDWQRDDLTVRGEGTVGGFDVFCTLSGLDFLDCSVKVNCKGAIPEALHMESRFKEPFRSWDRVLPINDWLRLFAKQPSFSSVRWTVSGGCVTCDWQLVDAPHLLFSGPLLKSLDIARWLVSQFDEQRLFPKVLRRIKESEDMSLLKDRDAFLFFARGWALYPGRRELISISEILLEQWPDLLDVERTRLADVLLQHASGTLFDDVLARALDSESASLRLLGLKHGGLEVKEELLAFLRDGTLPTTLRVDALKLYLSMFPAGYAFPVLEEMLESEHKEFVGQVGRSLVEVAHENAEPIDYGELRLRLLRMVCSAMDTAFDADSASVKELSAFYLGWDWLMVHARGEQDDELPLLPVPLPDLYKTYLSSQPLAMKPLIKPLVQLEFAPDELIAAYRLSLRFREELWLAGGVNRHRASNHALVSRELRRAFRLFTPEEAALGSAALCQELSYWPDDWRLRDEVEKDIADFGKHVSDETRGGISFVEARGGTLGVAEE